MNRLKPLGLLLALSLGACSVTPDYQRPQVLLPEQFEQPLAAAGTLDDRWWQLYRDSELDLLISKALTYNSSLLEAAARIEEAQANLKQAGASLLPSLDLQGGASRSGSSSTTGIPGPTSRQSFKLAVNTAFELDFWGKLKRYREGAAASLISSQYQRDTVALSLVADISSQYLQLRSLDSQIQALDLLLKNRSDSLSLIDKRVQAGIANELDLRQAQTALLAVKAQKLELVRSRALLNHQLALLSGEPGLQIAADTLDDLPLPPAVPAGLPSELLNKRPDLQAAEQQLVAAQANVSVAKTAFYPSISLTGQLGAESRELNDLFKADSRLWSLGIALDLPLFDSGQREAQQQKMEAQQKQLLATYTGKLRTAFKEVRDALSENRLSAELEQAQDQRVKAARDLLHLAQVRYEAGYVSYSDVLDAHKSLQEAELGRIQSRSDRLVASVQLMKALGGGWTAEAKSSSSR